MDINVKFRVRINTNSNINIDVNLISVDASIHATRGSIYLQIYLRISADISADTPADLYLCIHTHVYMCSGVQRWLLDAELCCHATRWVSLKGTCKGSLYHASIDHYKCRRFCIHYMIRMYI